MATAPGAPTGVIAVAQGGSAQVSWTAPASNGGSAVTAYAVTTSPGGATCATTGALTCVVGGMADGTYTFTAVASNAVGSGPASLPSSQVVIDTTPPPTPGVPVARLAAPSTLGTTVPLSLMWSGSSVSDLDHYEVWRSINGAPYVLLATPTSATWAHVFATSSITWYRFRITAVDTVGNVSAVADGASFHVRRIEQTAPSIRYAGTWSRVVATSASGGSYRTTNRAGASATFTFIGRTVALAAKRGPLMGAVRVYADGVLIATVSETAATTQWRQIVLSRSWPASGKHTIRLVYAGLTGRRNANVDAFIVLD